MATGKTQRAKFQVEESKTLKSLEKHLIPAPRQGAEIRAHFAYPNSYWVAMSNLGFQAVYSLFAEAPGYGIERAFLPEDSQESLVSSKPWRTFETSRLIGDCDVLAFSLSFETDYPNMCNMLKNAGLLTYKAEERDAFGGPAPWGAPLILAGGTSVTLNPEPVADLVDVCFIGEAEEFIPEFCQVLLQAKRDGCSRPEVLKRLAVLEGVYVPRFYQPEYAADGSVSQIQVRDDAPAKPRRRFVEDLSKFPTYTKILTPETEFRSMFLTETGRGCEMGCRFCVAGYIYRPVRKRSEESVSKTLDIGLKNADAVGFVGAAVSSHKAISRLAKKVADSGARASLSSLMSQKVNKELAASLSESEYKTVALAPEAGSERLRRAAGKRVGNAQVIQAATELAEAGIRGFKLYFILGLPTETDVDVDAMAELAITVREEVTKAARKNDPKGKQPWVVLSINPFIPKACTPFQWEPMLERKILEKKIDRVRQLVKKIPNVELHFESPKESYFQALMSRGDRRVAELLVLASQEGKDWKWLLQQADKQVLAHVPPLEFYASRKIPYDELLPWEVVDSRIDKKLLQRENERAYQGASEMIDIETPSDEALTTALMG